MLNSKQEIQKTKENRRDVKKNEDEKHKMR